MRILLRVPITKEREKLYRQDFAVSEWVRKKDEIGQGYPIHSGEYTHVINEKNAPKVASVVSRGICRDTHCVITISIYIFAHSLNTFLQF